MTPPPLPRAAAALLAIALACAGPRKQSWAETAPPEVLVEVLPRAAQVALDGVPLGPGTRTVPVPDASHVYRFRVTNDGFAAAERAAEGASLAGARLGVALRPEGFGTGRRLDLDDGEGLAAAAAFLLRRGDAVHAAEYAERAGDASPGLPLGHRVLGDASMTLGRRRRAIDAYSAYLRLAPTAPDAPAVAAKVEALRGDVSIPAEPR